MGWDGTARHGTVRYGMVWYGMAWNRYGLVCHGLHCAEFDRQAVTDGFWRFCVWLRLTAMELEASLVRPFSKLYRLQNYCYCVLQYINIQGREMSGPAPTSSWPRPLSSSSLIIALNLAHKVTIIALGARPLACYVISCYEFSS
jgi:hypothetical protein